MPYDGLMFWGFFWFYFFWRPRKRFAYFKYLSFFPATSVIKSLFVKFSLKISIWQWTIEVYSILFFHFCCLYDLCIVYIGTSQVWQLMDSIVRCCWSGRFFIQHHCNTGRTCLPHFWTHYCKEKNGVKCQHLHQLKPVELWLYSYCDTVEIDFWNWAWDKVKIFVRA